MTDRPTETMQRLNADFAALFGPVTPPDLLAPARKINDGTKTSERFDIA